VRHTFDAVVYARARATEVPEAHHTVPLRETYGIALDAVADSLHTGCQAGLKLDLASSHLVVLRRNLACSIVSESAVGAGAGGGSNLRELEHEWEPVEPGAILRVRHECSWAGEPLREDAIDGLDRLSDGNRHVQSMARDIEIESFPNFIFSLVFGRIDPIGLGVLEFFGGSLGFLGNFPGLTASLTWSINSSFDQ
jgi:hypothetical protein